MAATCQSCGAEIVWAETEAGRKIPLDAVPEKRFVIADAPLSRARVAVMQPTYVSHFATCPNAAEHRRK
jgi:hypothetical protein